MALNFNGVKVSVADSVLPDGYSKPEVTEFDDQEYDRVEILTVAKSTVEDPDDDTTVNAIRTALDTQIQAIITADYDTVTLTVDAWADWTILQTNFNKSGVKFTDGAINFLCTCITYIKTSV